MDTDKDTDISEAEQDLCSGEPFSGPDSGPVGGVTRNASAQAPPGEQLSCHDPPFAEQRSEPGSPAPFATALPETVLREAGRIGLNGSECNRAQLERLCSLYTPREVTLALRVMGEKAQTPCIRYLQKILLSWRESAPPPAHEAPADASPSASPAPPARLLNAQKYTQRQYTRQEMDELQQSLIREAMREDD